MLKVNYNMKNITKIKLKNFKRFKSFEVDFDENLNIFIGDNESGKSSILEAIDLVLCGSRSKVETAGLENLFNSEVIHNFLASNKNYNDTPTLFIELYFNEQDNSDLNGKNNSEKVICDGLKLEIIPDDDASKDIKDILNQGEPVFPFEFYAIKFSTFADSFYSGYKKYFKHILVDNSQISGEYAIKEYVKNMFNFFVQPIEKNIYQNEYRKHKESFRNNVLTSLNDKVPKYEFAIRNNSKSNLETDLILMDDNISIENKGKGVQSFIKTEFALNKTASNIDIILLEEPENHLSHINMKKLIDSISSATKRQIFISTHSNLICARLNLRNAIMLNSNREVPASLNKIDVDTASFFIKASNNKILEFVLSKKIVLVEGNAEFILMEVFFEKITGTKLETSDIHIISVDGICFKRYLEFAKVLKIKTAVVTDNDGKPQENCINNYADYSKLDFIKIFVATDDKLTTFEKCLYAINKDHCDTLFASKRKTLSVLDFMLKNKTEVAFQLLNENTDSLNVPDYIKEAIEWIIKE